MSLDLAPIHPRVCGEQEDDDLADGSATGSSPRLRGTVLGRLGRFCSRRTIPGR